ncbi:MAG: hypothetical protein JW810_14715 [Sedimentisphaerales bacterium]|nr:hypothetical protein [Sedimentisphaerales bacterium]
MKRYTAIILTGLLLGAAAPAATGQAPSTPAQYAQTIAPFVDDQTFAVARLDVSRVDIEAIFQKLWGFLPDPSDSDAALPEDVTVALQTAQLLVAQWQQVFVQAGGRDIYGVYSMNDVPYFFVAVPLSAQANVPMIKSWLATVAKACDIGPFGQERIGDVLVAGRKETVERVRSLTAANRPELSAAFAGAGDAAIEVLLIPTRDQRRVIEEMLPSLPLGPQPLPSSTLTRGISWASLGIKSPPALAIHAAIQSEDAASAEALQGVIGAALGLARTHPELRKVFANLDRMIDMLTPVQRADRIVLDLESKEIDVLLGELFRPLLFEVRRENQLAQCMNRLRSIGSAILAYQEGHQGQSPPDLKTALKEADINEAVLVCPASGDAVGQVSYVYRGLDLKAGCPVELILAYDRPGNHPNMVHVLFVDGHVERTPKDLMQTYIEKDNEIRRRNQLPEKPLGQ